MIFYEHNATEIRQNKLKKLPAFHFQQLQQQ